ncbi:sigma-70 family RNA polymerase sigma factor [Amycolatopsis samaneae]|uniref:Sigma-70 family RNA polymerase sigma factor n=1 Tax=Amycolatopsis samaneae TaxID=664691 RepID=A0ABW5GRA7_9PSEU
MRNQEIGSFGVEDCVQEILLAVTLALPHYEKEADKFFAFVFGIAAHKVSDYYRRRAREVHTFPTDILDFVTPSPHSSPDTIGFLEHKIAAQDLLTKLPKLHAQVLALRTIFGFTAEETARLLDMPSAGAVRVTQCRALSRLRQLLTAQGLSSRNS